MIEKHRDIAFDVHQLTDEKWEVESAQRQQKPRRLRGLGSTHSSKEKRAAN